MISGHLRGNAVGYAAVFIALTGTAVALPGRGTVTGDDIRKDAVRSKHIRADQITGEDVLESSLVGVPLSGAAGGDLAGSYPAPTLAANAVSSADVAPDSLAATDLADGSVGSGELANDAVDSAKVGPNSLTAADLGANSVGPSELQAVPAARVQRSTDLALATNVFVRLAFDVEVFDVGGMFDPDPALASRLTAPRDGVYMISGTVCWEQDPDGVRLLRLQISGLGGPDLAADHSDAANDTGASIETRQCQTVSTVAALTMGEFMALEVAHTAGNDLDVVAHDRYSPVLSMAWIGPAS